MAKEAFNILKYVLNLPANWPKSSEFGYKIRGCNASYCNDDDDDDDDDDDISQTDFLTHPFPTIGHKLHICSLL